MIEVLGYQSNCLQQMQQYTLSGFILTLPSQPTRLTRSRIGQCELLHLPLTSIRESFQRSEIGSSLRRGSRLGLIGSPEEDVALDAAVGAGEQVPVVHHHPSSIAGMTSV